MWDWFAGLAIIGSLAGCFARWAWVCELCAHFRLQYAIALALLAAVAACRGGWQGACLTGGVALVHLSLIAPFYCRRLTPVAASTSIIRVLFANVLCFNRHPRALLDLLEARAPDVVVLTEFSPEWLPTLSSLSTAYPVSKLHIYKGAYSIGLLSRMPVDDVRIVFPGPQGLPTIMGRVRVGARTLTVMGTHPRSPVTARGAALRDAQLRALAQLASAQAGPVLLVGDLNTTSWSPIFGDVLRAGGLRDSRRGFGLQTTWPAPLRWIGLSIDHALVSSDVTVRRHEVGPWIGSDHFPIVLDLALGASDENFSDGG